MAAALAWARLFHVSRDRLCIAATKLHVMKVPPSGLSQAGLAAIRSRTVSGLSYEARSCGPQSCSANGPICRFMGRIAIASGEPSAVSLGTKRSATAASPRDASCSFVPLLGN